MIGFTHLSEVKTGDIFLFSNNTCKGLAVRFFTGSTWNHVGVCVRIDNGEMTKDATGEVYIIQLTPKAENIISPFEEIKERYNAITYRPMKESYRTDRFIQRIGMFLNKYKESTFTTDILPYISIFTGLRFISGMRYEDGKMNMFCSEFLHYFYIYTLEIDGLFNTPPELTTPGHFDPEREEVNIFEKDMYCIKSMYLPFYIIILIPLLMSIVLIIMIWMMLQRNNSKSDYTWVRKMSPMETSLKDAYVMSTSDASSKDAG
jgi:hypothetical protein